MTKLVYAVSMSDVLQKYKDLKILSVVQIDLAPPEDEDDELLYCKGNYYCPVNKKESWYAN